ncbi:MAG: patatin-like phospholipase family protein [Actinomycetota bacterium]|nr:patatin-like phospholipase family protein [Actinomycetota bacterium]
MLSVLLPELEARGQRPTVIVGTSTGALNAAFLGAVAGCGAEEAAGRLVEGWMSVERKDVFHPIVRRQAPLIAARFAGEVLGLPGRGLLGLLDPEPLRATLDRLIDWAALHDNVSSGAVRSVALVACDAANPRSVVFVEGAEARHLPPARAIEYVPCELSGQHARASSAIPVLFPAVRVEQPADACGWYFDGGTRLNTPLKPALDLGVDRVVVIASHSVAPRRSEEHLGEDARPDFADGAVQLLHATLVDPMTEDVRRLGKTNLMVPEGRTRTPLRDHRRAEGRAPYRQVPYMFVAPRTRGAVGDIASAVFARRFGGYRGLRDPDMAVLSRLLGGQSEQHGELISYVLFEPAFHEELIALGRRDAHRWLERVTGADAPWYTKPIDSLPDS